ncbi:hypothetical protein D3C81_1363110 [compost metagenome]
MRVRAHGNDRQRLVLLPAIDDRYQRVLDEPVDTVVARIGSDSQSFRTWQLIEEILRIVWQEKIVAAGIDDVFRNRQPIGITSLQVA